MVDQSDPRVFISYRRDDTKHITGRICDQLIARLGQSDVFIDVASIRPGQDFGAAIKRAIEQCDVLLAIMGEKWSKATDPTSRLRRLEDPNDPVAMEIEHALRCQIPVIPVLIDGATLPQRQELPKRLRPLLDVNAIRVQHETFHADVNRLLEFLTSPRPSDHKTDLGLIINRRHFKLQHATGVPVDDGEQTPEYRLVQQACKEMMDKWSNSYSEMTKASRRKERSYGRSSALYPIKKLFEVFTSLKAQSTHLAHYYEDRRWILLGANVARLRDDCLEIRPVPPTEDDSAGRAALCPTAYSARRYAELAAEVRSDIERLLADAKR